MIGVYKKQPVYDWDDPYYSSDGGNWIQILDKGIQIIQYDKLVLLKGGNSKYDPTSTSTLSASIDKHVLVDLGNSSLHV